VKLLLDANLSPRVARLLKEAGHDAIHVADIGLLTATDPVILRAAAKEKCILLTVDPLLLEPVVDGGIAHAKGLGELGCFRA
jgi:predicted nuclease of predicted toxin-antitoxin system